MTFSPTTRRWITPAVLAGYVLVITFSGLFHQHEAGSCCSESVCSRQAGLPESDHGHSHDHSHSHGSACHGHSHHHAGAGHSHHPAESSTAEGPQPHPAKPRSDDPLKHANCAACQLLAEQSLSAPAFVLECAGLAAFRDVVATEIRIPSALAATHPARGPPSAG